nr:hypothetical protein [Raoultella planticola]
MGEHQPECSARRRPITGRNVGQTLQRADRREDRSNGAFNEHKQGKKQAADRAWFHGFSLHINHDS